MFSLNQIGDKRIPYRLPESLLCRSFEGDSFISNNLLHENVSIRPSNENFASHTDNVSLTTGSDQGLNSTQAVRICFFKKKKTLFL